MLNVMLIALHLLTHFNHKNYTLLQLQLFPIKNQCLMRLNNVFKVTQQAYGWLSNQTVTSKPRCVLVTPSPFYHPDITLLRKSPCFIQPEVFLLSTKLPCLCRLYSTSLKLPCIVINLKTQECYFTLFWSLVQWFMEIIPVTHGMAKKTIWIKEITIMNFKQDTLKKFC